MAKNKHLETVEVSSEAIKNGPVYHNKWSNAAKKYINICTTGIEIATEKEAIPLR
jgi:hypothetical protein